MLRWLSMNGLEIKQEETDRLDLRCDEVREILGDIPSRILRWGITVMLVIVFLVLVGACFFRYPDTIAAHFIIHSSNPTVTLLAKTNGNIVKLNVSDREKVKKGDCLAVISSTADYRQMLDLKKRLQNTDSVQLPYTGSLKLGNVQAAYTQYGKALIALRDYLNIDLIGTKIRLSEAQLQGKKEQIELYRSAEQLGRRTLGIEQSAYMRAEKIYRKEGISLNELEQYQARMIQAEVTCNNHAVERSRAESAVTQTEREILELKTQKEQDICKLKDDLSTALQSLKAAFREWENNYCIISTIDGIVSFSNVWKEQQNVLAGQDLMSVVPEEKNRILARIYIPVPGAGKLKEGDHMSLMFDDYPEEEYGVVHCNLGKLSLVPDSLFASTLNLPDTLVSNYGKILPFHQNMTGKAMIITDDVSLIVRLINPLRLAVMKYRFKEKNN